MSWHTQSIFHELAVRSQQMEVQGRKVCAIECHRGAFQQKSRREQCKSCGQYPESCGALLGGLDLVPVQLLQLTPRRCSRLHLHWHKALVEGIGTRSMPKLSLGPEMGGK